MMVKRKNHKLGAVIRLLKIVIGEKRNLTALVFNMPTVFRIEDKNEDKKDQTAADKKNDVYLLKSHL